MPEDNIIGNYFVSVGTLHERLKTKPLTTNNLRIEIRYFANIIGISCLGYASPFRDLI
jgi:hypothetical protein